MALCISAGCTSAKGAGLENNTTSASEDSTWIYPTIGTLAVGGAVIAICRTNKKTCKDVLVDIRDWAGDFGQDRLVRMKMRRQILVQEMESGKPNAKQLKTALRRFQKSHNLYYDEALREIKKTDLRNENFINWRGLEAEKEQDEKLIAVVEKMIANLESNR